MERDISAFVQPSNFTSEETKDQQAKGEQFVQGWTGTYYCNLWLLFPNALSFLSYYTLLPSYRKL